MFESHFHGFVVSRWVTTTVLGWTGRRRVTASWWPRWSSSWPTSTAPPRPITSTPPGPTASPRSSMNRYAHELGFTVTVTVDFLFTLSTLDVKIKRGFLSTLSKLKGAFCLPCQNWVGRGALWDILFHIPDQPHCNSEVIWLLLYVKIKH